MPRPILLLALLALGAGASANKPMPPPKTDPEAAEILKRMTAYYQGLPGFRVEAATVMKYGGGGKVKVSFAMQQPSRIAITVGTGIEAASLGSSVFADGKTVSVVSSDRSTYSQTEQPATLAETFALPKVRQGGGPSAALMGLLLGVPVPQAAQNWMGIPRAWVLVGSEKIAGAEYARVRCVHDKVDWDLWVAKADPPLVRKAVLDFSRAIDMDATGRTRSQKITAEFVYDFGEWSTAAVPETTFAFTPPPNAKEEAENPFDTSETSDHALVGETAPDFEVASLDGGKIDLAQHVGKNVVILDFWATWCGPCVRALPILAEVAASYQAKGVVFYAMNQREEPAAIRAFLERSGLKLTVGLDRDGKVGALYDVEGIPQTVLIDKKGNVAAVHVGFAEDLKERLTRELDALVAGKTVHSKPMKEPELKGLTEEWQLDGRFCGLAADGTRLLALLPGGTVAEIEPAGERERDFKIERARGMMRVANLAGGSSRAIVSFESWGPEVRATDAEGKPLWKYPGGQGVDDVWCADLDGDGRDEIIVGYNGSTGLHVLSPGGKLLWSSTEVGNVWHVCAGDVLGGKAPEVVTTSAQGQVHIFDAKGKMLKTVDPGIYANMVRVADGTIYVGGSGETHLEIRALDAEGQVKWKADLGPETGHVDAMQIAGGLIGATLRGGRVVVLDAKTGAILGEATGLAPRSELAWLPAQDKAARPLLVVTTSGGLRAYRIP